MGLFRLGFLVAAALVLVSARPGDDDICIELNSGTTNGALEAEVLNLMSVIAANSRRPQPELNLPILEPIRIRSIGPLKVLDNNGKLVNVVLTDVVSFGVASSFASNVRVTGKGNTRAVDYNMNFGQLTLSGVVRTEDSNGKPRTEVLELLAKNVVFKVTGVVSPRATTIRYSLVSGGPLVTRRPSSLNPISQKVIFAHVTGIANAQVDATALEEALESECDNSGEQKVLVPVLGQSVPVPVLKRNPENHRIVVAPKPIVTVGKADRSLEDLREDLDLDGLLDDITDDRDGERVLVPVVRQRVPVPVVKQNPKIVNAVKPVVNVRKADRSLEDLRDDLDLDDLLDDVTGDRYGDRVQVPVLRQRVPVPVVKQNPKIVNAVKPVVNVRKVDRKLEDLRDDLDLDDPLDDITDDRDGRKDVKKADPRKVDLDDLKDDLHDRLELKRD